MLYPRAMGDAFAALPEALRAFHGEGETASFRGSVEVSHGGPLARALAGAGGMPVRAGEMPFRFRVTRDLASRDGAEVWERDFDGHITRSRQWLHTPGVIAEQVGASRFLMRPEVRGEALHIPITGVTGFGLPLPGAILRSCEGVERVTPAGEISFDVHARVWAMGLIVRYRGVMAAA